MRTFDMSVPVHIVLKLIGSLSLKVAVSHDNFFLVLHLAL